MTFLIAAAALLAPRAHDDHPHTFLPHYEAPAQTAGPAPSSMTRAPLPEETAFGPLRQLTFGGQNAEAYWSKDGKRLVYQALLPGYPDEQIFTMNADGTGKELVSTGKGRCTCSFFTPDGKSIVLSSTHERNEGPQMTVDRSKGYVWVVNPDYQIYRTPARLKAGQARTYDRLTDLPGKYAAETTIAPNGKYMVWTTDKDGDLEIYRSKLDGTDARRLTDAVGYDGGPFVSWDSKTIAYRRDVVKTPGEIEKDKALLAEHLVRPSKLEIWVMDADGSNKRQVTNLGCASFAPFVHPNGKTLVFSSNYGDPKGREFDIFQINLDGSGLKRITRSPEFDGFPMFTRDGKKLVFASNRFGAVAGETNIFVTDWRG